MKSHYRTLFLLAAMLMAGFPLSAEESTVADRKDPVAVPLSKEIVKKGWNAGLLPAFYYNSDLGVSAGVLGQLFDYGDGAVYPDYRHKFSANAMIYTKGAKQVSLDYDSKYLIPGKRVTASFAYMDNPLCGFYGFNGAVSPFHADLDTKKSADGSEGIAFYSVHQQRLSASVDLQGRVADGLTWIGGGSYSWQRYSNTQFRVYDGTESLFHQYVGNGLIPESDTHGHRAELKGGLVYDTRDFEPNPERGIYATVTTMGGMSVSGGVRSSLVLAADFRHYLPILPSRLTLAYQFSCKTLVAGSLPFYALPAFSMRGSFGTRIVGNGVAWASADLRLCVARFQAFKQNIELGLVGFADAGAVIRPYQLKEQSALGAVPAEKELDGALRGPYASIFDPAIATRERLHSSAGGGFWYSMNKNFIVAVEFGRPFNSQDGGLGVYINMGFSF